MKKTLLLLVMLALAPLALAQTYGLMIYDGAKWVPATTTASANAVPTVSGQVRMMCYNTGLGKWVPADSSCFGGGGGGGDLSGTLTPGYMPVATAAHTLADGYIDNGVTLSYATSFSSAAGQALYLISNGTTTGDVYLQACNDDGTTCSDLDIEAPGTAYGSAFQNYSDTKAIEMDAVDLSDGHLTSLKLYPPIHNAGSGITVFPSFGILVGDDAASTHQFVFTASTRHLSTGYFGGTVPTVNHGTWGGGTDNGGIINDLSADTTVTLTFAQPFSTGLGASTVACVANASAALATAPYVSAIGVNSVTWTFSALTGSLYYHCDGY